MKRINLNLTTEIEAYDPDATMNGAQLNDYLERYRKAVNSKLCEAYDDAEVTVSVGGFGGLHLEGFEDEDEERRYIEHTQNEIFGAQQF